MRENRDFVVPVNILTPLCVPRFLGPHNTLPCVLIQCLKYGRCLAWLNGYKAVKNWKLSAKKKQALFIYLLFIGNEKDIIGSMS